MKRNCSTSQSTVLFRCRGFQIQLKWRRFRIWAHIWNALHSFWMSPCEAMLLIKAGFHCSKVDRYTEWSVTLSSTFYWNFFTKQTLSKFEVINFYSFIAYDMTLACCPLDMQCSTKCMVISSVTKNTTPLTVVGLCLDSNSFTLNFQTMSFRLFHTWL